MFDGLGIESRWKLDFSNPSVPALGCTQPSVTVGNGSLFRGVMRPERGVNHPFPPSADVEERVELQLYSVSGPS